MFESGKSYFYKGVLGQTKKITIIRRTSKTLWYTLQNNENIRSKIYLDRNGHEYIILCSSSLPYIGNTSVRSNDVVE